MVDYQGAVYHVGIRVPDLEAAMADIGAALGLTWAKVVEREQRIWTPRTGATTTPLRVVYSCEGPQHIELLQGEPGTVWDGSDLPGLHHVGIWVDDVAAEVDRRTGAGWTLEGSQLAPEHGYGAMAYLRSPQGFLLEPVASYARPMHERWWAGDDFS